jgi:hypothetical protein
MPFLSPASGWTVVGSSACLMPTIFGHRGRSVEVLGYNLQIMLVALGCVIGLAVVIGIARVLRARSTLNKNRVMRDYLRRIASDSNSF